MLGMGARRFSKQPSKVLKFKRNFEFCENIMKEVLFPPSARNPNASLGASLELYFLTKNFSKTRKTIETCYFGNSYKFSNIKRLIALRQMIASNYKMLKSSKDPSLHLRISF